MDEMIKVRSVLVPGRVEFEWAFNPARFELRVVVSGDAGQPVPKCVAEIDPIVKWASLSLLGVSNDRRN